MSTSEASDIRTVLCALSELSIRIFHASSAPCTQWMEEHIIMSRTMNLTLIENSLYRCIRKIGPKVH